MTRESAGADWAIIFDKRKRSKNYSEHVSGCWILGPVQILVLFLPTSTLILFAFGFKQYPEREKARQKHHVRGKIDFIMYLIVPQNPKKEDAEATDDILDIGKKFVSPFRRGIFVPGQLVVVVTELGAVHNKRDTVISRALMEQKNVVFAPVQQTRDEGGRTRSPSATCSGRPEAARRGSSFLKIGSGNAFVLRLDIGDTAKVQQVDGDFVLLEGKGKILASDAGKCLRKVMVTVRCVGPHQHEMQKTRRRSAAARRSPRSPPAREKSWAKLGVKRALEKGSVGKHLAQNAKRIWCCQ